MEEGPMAMRPNVVGNRLVLIGALVYLLEWVAIVPAGNTGPSDPGVALPDVTPLYNHDVIRQAFLVSWLSVVLLGRIAIPVGIKAALRKSERPNPVMGVAVAAMTVSVVLEMAGEAVTGAAAHLASRGTDPGVIVTLDAVAAWILLMLWAPLAVSVFLSAYALLRARLVPAWMSWLGLAAGTFILVAGLTMGPARVEAGGWRTVSNIASVGVPGFWLWMLATGAYLFMKTPRRTPAATPTGSTEPPMGS